MEENRTSHKESKSYGCSLQVLSLFLFWYMTGRKMFRRARELQGEAGRGCLGKGTSVEFCGMIGVRRDNGHLTLSHFCHWRQVGKSVAQEHTPLCGVLVLFTLRDLRRFCTSQEYNLLVQTHSGCHFGCVWSAIHEIQRETQWSWAWLPVLLLLLY